MEMFIWNVVFEQSWDYMDERDFANDPQEYTVVAADYDGALETAKQIAMAETSFDEDKNQDHFVRDVRLTQIKRGKLVDGVASLKPA